MEFLVFLALLIFGVYTLNSRDQRVRITLLGSYLGQYRIEKLMENLTQGYLRALGESNLERQESIWRMLSTSEAELCEQFNAFVLEFARVDEAQARVSKLAFAIPYVTKWLPGNTFDMRKALSLHAHAIDRAVHVGQQQAHRDRAFTLMAEMFLMQHSCHWFCRSKIVASARLMARHKTPYAQVVASVAAQTRKTYCALIGS